MARARFEAVGSVTVWMIIFVALWLASTVFLVILYTGQEELVTENTRLKDDNLRLISDAEHKSVTLFQAAKKEGPTVVGLLEKARGETARLATGNAADDTATVRLKLDKILQAVRSERLVPQAEAYGDVSFQEALNMLYEVFGAQHAQLRAASERVAQLEGEVDRLGKSGAELRSDFERRARELSDQLAEVEADRATKLRERDETLTRLQRAFEEGKQQSDADVTKARQQVSALEEKRARLQERFAVYQEKFGELLIGPEELATARQPDGRILTAIPGDNVVYIDIGRRDSLVMGLQFGVYSAETGIPTDGRAKAQIEVVSISDTWAECKIVRLPGNEVILERDLLANPVYDRRRSLSFVVAGDFDLDHDGTADSDGPAAIESIITAWGGTVSGELTALTDFVVLGASPRRPKGGREIAGEPTERAKAMQQLYDRYANTLESAKSLSVPIMPQEVFLNFLGYAVR
jgi:FtsZ-binding cell division protein ZapB